MSLPIHSSQVKFFTLFSLANEKIRSSAWPQSASGILSLPIKHFSPFAHTLCICLASISCIQPLGPVVRQAGIPTSSMNEPQGDWGAGKKYFF